MRRLMGAVVSALVLLGVRSRARGESKEGFACALHALSATDSACKAHAKPSSDSPWALDDTPRGTRAETTAPIRRRIAAPP